MSTVLVAGATGKQGGAVTELLLEHGHQVRALVRDPDSERAKALAAKGVFLAFGDLSDADALKAAAAGADAVFGLSVPFGAGGKEQEVSQGKLLIDVVRELGTHLVYSSVRGADRIVDSQVEHASSKQLIEAYLRETDVRATVLGPAYFMENALNVNFNRLKNGVFATPLSPGKKLDQATVLDIAGLAVAAIEDPDVFVGRRIDLASDSVSGEETAQILGGLLGKEIPYQQIPIDQVRQWSGNEVATMFERFEQNTYFLDIAGLKAKYPQVAWHTFAGWAATVDWERLISG